MNMDFNGGGKVPLGGILFFGGFVINFGAAMLLLTSITGKPKRREAIKQTSYECGLPSQEKSDTKVSVKYYLTAILFIIFDIEIIFMYPWAITYKEFIAGGWGLYIFSVMMIFLFVFIFGLFWEVKSKALEWE
ncbi:MAG: NADH-quinone oxidoreductase subunit A [Pseudobdellovibrionaceae bacterium]